MRENLKYEELVRYHCEMDADLTRLRLNFEDIPFKMFKIEKEHCDSKDVREQVVFEVPSHSLKNARALLTQYREIQGVPFN